MYRIENDKIKYCPLYIHTFKFGKEKKESYDLTDIEINEQTQICDKLKYYRKMENLTCSEISDYIGVSNVTYYKYEKGVNKYPLKVMIKLSERYGVMLEDLLDDYHNFIYNNQGKSIKKIREELGVKQYELASLLGIECCVVRNCEQDKSYMSREVFNNLMNLYNEYIGNNIECSNL